MSGLSYYERTKKGMVVVRSYWKRDEVERARVPDLNVAGTNCDLGNDGMVVVRAVYCSTRVINFANSGSSHSTFSFSI